MLPNFSHLDKSVPFHNSEIHSPEKYLPFFYTAPNQYRLFDHEDMVNKEIQIPIFYQIISPNHAYF